MLNMATKKYLQISITPYSTHKKKGGVLSNHNSLFSFLVLHGKLRDEE